MKHAFSKTAPRRVLLASSLLVAAFAAPAWGQGAIGSATKTIDGNPATVQTGQTLTYRLSFSCSGLQGPCGTFTMTDTLPPEVIYLSGSVGNPDFTYDDSGAPTIVVTDDDFVDGDIVEVVINVQVRDDLDFSGGPVLVTNTASATFSLVAPGAENPVERSVSTTVLPPTERWSVSKVRLEPEIDPVLGGNAIYQLQLCPDSQLGNLDLTNVVLTDTFPAGAVVVDADGGTVVPSTITWSFPSLDYTAGCVTRVIELSFPAGPFTGSCPPDNLTNSASATGEYTGSGGPQPIGSASTNHCFTASTPRLAAGKSLGTNRPLPPGAPGNFVLTLTHDGNQTVPAGATFTDAIPPQLTATSVVSGTWTPGSIDADVGYSTTGAGGPYILLGNVTGGSNTTFPLPAGVTHVRWVWNDPLPITFAAGGLRIDFTVNIGTPPANYTNCADAVWTGTGSPDQACADFGVPDPASAIYRLTKTMTPGTAGPGVDVQIRLRLFYHSLSGSNLVNPTMVDLLPPELVFVSWDSFNAVNANGSVVNPYLDITPAGPNSLLRWSWSGSPPPGAVQLSGAPAGGPNSMTLNPPTNTPDGETRLEVVFTARVADLTPASTYNNNFQSSAEAPISFCWLTGSTPDGLDIDRDSLVAEPNCSTNTSLTVPAAAFLVAEKWVGGFEQSDVNPPLFPNIDPLAPTAVPNPPCPDDGDDRTRFPCVAQGVDAELFNYRLRLKNRGNVPLSQYVVYDVLPFVGDTGVSESLSAVARLSEWAPLLEAPLSPFDAFTTAALASAGAVVEYSASTNPCRPEVSDDGDESGWQGSCTNDWTPTFSGNPRAFRIVVPFASPNWLPGEELVLDVSLRIPAGTRPGAIAWNSLAHRATNASAASRLPTAEPRKVGIVVRYADFGDAPNANYGTRFTSNGPYHLIYPGFGLGANEDIDSGNGNGNTNANQDDSSGSPDDEDSVTFPGGLAAARACDSTSITVTAKNDAVAGFPTIGPGFLNAWIDWNRDGDFDAAEQIADDLAVSAGPNLVSFTVPCNVAHGISYLRLRLSELAGDLGPTFPYPSPDSTGPYGEIEDHRYDLRGRDFGDAPNSYSTTEAANGPRHTIIDGFRLGANEDTEADGQPVATGTPANGDDTAGSAPDDEDGVVIVGGMPAACSAGNPLTVTLTNTAGIATPRLDGWMDWNGNGVFDHPAEHLFGGTSAALSAGTNNLSFPVPCSAVPQAVSYARFRLSSTGSLTPQGDANNGEVEDYEVQIKGVDFGDAPDSYGTTFAANGPRHAVISAGFGLGPTIDNETDGQPSPGADGDGADEDGVVIVGGMPGACSTGNELTVTLRNTAALATARLDAWIDWNGNGVFDHPAEHLFAGTSAAVGPASGTYTLTFDAPCAVVPQTLSYARFRMSSTGGLTPTGQAADGEVEDTTVMVKGVDYGDAPDTYGTTLGANGPHHTLIPGYSLGPTEDNEANGQPTVGATGDGADEDGVAFAGGTAMAGACSTGNGLTVTLENTVGIPTARLDAWIDWNGNGVFDHPAEHLFAGASATLASGANNLSYDVPCDAVPQAVSYARFRLSSAGGLLPTGAGNAADGEVEDYNFEVKGVDFGDAPDSYGTTLAANGPHHTLVPGFSLGPLEDTEADGQPSPDALGDGADEDGVVIVSGIPGACTTGNELTVTLNNTAGVATARLDAWIDWNANGVFDHPGEHLFGGVSAPLGPASGTFTLTYTAPCDVVPQTTSYARFRLSSIGGLAPTGAGNKADGEVEDYALGVQGVDFGDAPDTYGTQLPNGASHTIVPGFQLGAANDTEPNGQPTGGANGDDTDSDGDDEDGVDFGAQGLMAVACSTANPLTVTLTNTAGLAQARLDAWIDWNRDGDFDHPAEHLFAGTSAVLVSGANNLPYDVPCSVNAGASYARFRLSSAGGLLPTLGKALDGEVEDYPFQLKGLDFGDAPDPTYPVLLASNGGRHVVQPAANPTLGPLVDTEANGQPSAGHDGDDTFGVDDEDGVTLPTVLLPGKSATFVLTGGATGGLVDAWVDWNRDGDWNDPGEQIATGFPVAANTAANLTVIVPATAVAGASCARFRISTAGGLAPSGLANDGEVEDYALSLGAAEPMIGASKRASLVERVDGSTFRVVYEIEIENLGNVTLHEVQSVVQLSIAYADAASFAVETVTSADFTVNPGFDGDADANLLAAGNDLAPGVTGILQLSVLVVPDGNPGPYVCSTTVSGETVDGQMVVDESQDGDNSDPDGNGDPGDNNDPTVVVFQLSVLEIPTLSEWGLLLLVALLSLAAVTRMRR